MVDKIKSSNDNGKSSNNKNYVSLKLNSIITIMFVAILAVVIGSVFIWKFQSGRGAADCRYINIEGEAEREVMADTAEWSIYFEHVGEKQSDLNKMISLEKPKVLEFLIDNGISKDEIEFFNYIKEDHGDKKGNDAIRYRMGYCAHIKTTKMKTVTNLKNNLSELFSEDIGIVRNILEVSYSKQAKVEQELCKKATQNAIDKALDLTDFLKIKLKKILKIENPRFYTSSLVPNVDMNGGRRMMATFQNAEENASNEILKRKIKANINLQIEIR